MCKYRGWHNHLHNFCSDNEKMALGKNWLIRQQLKRHCFGRLRSLKITFSILFTQKHPERLSTVLGTIYKNHKLTSTLISRSNLKLSLNRHIRLHRRVNHSYFKTIFRFTNLKNVAKIFSRDVRPNKHLGSFCVSFKIWESSNLMNLVKFPSLDNKFMTIIVG